MLDAVSTAIHGGEAAVNGELTSAAVLLREQPGFYEKPRFSRRLVKRFVRRQHNTNATVHTDTLLYFLPDKKG